MVCVDVGRGLGRILRYTQLREFAFNSSVLNQGLPKGGHYTKEGTTREFGNLENFYQF
jgi:hypothetical protein